MKTPAGKEALLSQFKQILDGVAKTADKVDIDDDRAVAFEIEIELTDPARIIDQPIDYVEYVLRYGVMLCQDVIRLSGA